jgi:DNA-binding winged helix-turn-helix (wHTH) protein
MASAQVCRYNATQRRKIKFRTLSMNTERYDRVTEKAEKLGYPRVAILEYLVDHYLDTITEEMINHKSSYGRRL